MLVEPPARGIRVGGETVAPGEARAVAIALTERARRTDAEGEGAVPAARQVPAWAAVGNKVGPRITVVAAVRGFETAAAQAAGLLIAGVDPVTLAGSLVVVPVLRVGGAFAPHGRPGEGWRFPGDAGGARAARDAFTLFSELVVGASVLVVLGAPPLGQRGALTVRAALDDPRTRRLALQSGAVVALAAAPPPGSLRAAAVGAGVMAVDLRAAGTPGPDDGSSAEALVQATRAVLAAAGLWAQATPGDGAGKPRPSARGTPPAPPIVDGALVVRAPHGGLVEDCVAVGQFVRKGAVLARLRPPVGGKGADVVAPRDGLILEATFRTGVRAGAKMFVLVPLSRAAARRRDLGTGRPDAASATAPTGGAAARASAGRGAPKLHVGWVENVVLPSLGIKRLKAKIDTGARSSALHVSRMRTVGTVGGPGRRPILEIVVPSGRRGGKSLKVRAAVREYVVVRDTSGRVERRPVIETALQLGPLTKRIAVTLTDRGEMLFPMLIGRTALGPGIVVDPARRYLISS